MTLWLLPFPRLLWLLPRPKLLASPESREELEVRKFSLSAKQLGSELSLRGTGRATGKFPPNFAVTAAAFAMATSGTDSQWSDFVYWVVMTIIYAEESAGQQGLDSLPEVYLFGDGFRNLMKDAVNAVGSYKEIYVRHLEAGLPRSGANQVNMGQFKGPQQFPLPL